MINYTVAKDQLVSAIISELAFHAKFSNLVHIIYNTLSQIGERFTKNTETFIKSNENVRRQIPPFDHK